MLVDTVFSKARVYNVFLKQWNSIDIAVLAGKIIYTGDIATTDILAQVTIDCENKPLIPGLIDIHLHIESSLCTPATFGGAVLSRGVTTVVSEPHEIANVFGLSGIEEMIRVSAGAGIDIFYGVPSSVPSTNSKLETTGGAIGSEELKKLVDKYPEIICLGEVMNHNGFLKDFNKIVTGEKKYKSLELISYMQDYVPLAAIEGHCPAVKDFDLAKLLYLGIDSDHCLQDVEGMYQRFANGMFVELQEKSITPEIVTYLQSHAVEGLYSFVTDDVPPDILEEKGHLDYVVRKAMREGLSLEKVIVATSLSPAKRMGFRDRGVIAPGKIADFILLDDFSSDFKIRSVYKRGVLSQPNMANNATHRFKPKFLNSLNLSATSISEAMYTVKVGRDLVKNGVAKCRIIRKNHQNTYTESVVRSLPVDGGTISWESLKADVNLVIVIDRYSGEAGSATGFIDGVRLHNGAFCTSHAHDHHNILLLGDRRADMKIALNRIIEQKGGMCVVSGGERLASVALPVGGILSEAPLKELAKDVQAIQQSLKTLGIEHENPIMSLCTLTLPVSPELKITNMGLVDVTKSKIVPLLAE